VSYFDEGAGPVISTLMNSCSQVGSGSLLVIQAACYAWMDRSFYMKKKLL